MGSSKSSSDNQNTLIEIKYSGNSDGLFSSWSAIGGRATIIARLVQYLAGSLDGVR